MKILIIHNDYQQAGGERVAVNNLVTLLRNKNHQVVFYSRKNEEIDNFNLLDKTKFFTNTIYSSRTYREVTALCKDEPPDIAHVHNVFPLISPSAYLALKQFNIPIVQTLYNFRLVCPNGLFYTQGHICELCKFGNTLHAIRYRCYKDSYLLSALYSLAIGLHRSRGTFDLIDQFICPAPFTGNKLIESGLVPKSKLATISFFVSDPHPDPGSFQHRQPYFVYLGRFSFEKGIWALINAVAGIPEINLKMIGGGPISEDVKSYISDHNVSNIKLLGFVFGEDMLDILRNATASIVPSVWYENSPYSMINSLLVGTPLVVSDLGSLPDIVQDGINGLVFEPGNTLDLREKITWIKDNPDVAIRLGQNGYQQAKIDFSSESYYQKLMSLYSDLMD